MGTSVSPCAQAASAGAASAGGSGDDESEEGALLAGLRDAAGVYNNASGAAGGCYALPADHEYDGIWDYQWRGPRPQHGVLASAETACRFVPETTRLTHPTECLEIAQVEQHRQRVARPLGEQDAASVYGTTATL